MLEQLQTFLGAANPQVHANVGETYFLNSTVAAYYYLRAKCVLFAHHCQSSELKDWWNDAARQTQERLKELEEYADRMGVPRPPSIPVSTEMTDHFMAVDGMAMVQGMLTADAIGLQSAWHPQLGALYYRMLGSTMLFGARLQAIAEKEAWVVPPPAYLGIPRQ